MCLRPQELKPRKTHDLDGALEPGLRQGRCTLWRLGKTAIWLQKCGFIWVLGTLAKLNFCRPPELKPRKTHDLERSGRKVGGAGGALLGLR